MLIAAINALGLSVLLELVRFFFFVEVFEKGLLLKATLI